MNDETEAKPEPERKAPPSKVLEWAVAIVLMAILGGFVAGIIHFMRELRAF